jgi:hypothetical protein
MLNMHCKVTHARRWLSKHLLGKEPITLLELAAVEVAGKWIKPSQREQRTCAAARTVKVFSIIHKHQPFREHRHPRRTTVRQGQVRVSDSDE